MTTILEGALPPETPPTLSADGYGVCRFGGRTVRGHLVYLNPLFEYSLVTLPDAARTGEFRLIQSSFAPLPVGRPVLVERLVARLAAIGPWYRHLLQKHVIGRTNTNPIVDPAVAYKTQLATMVDACDDPYVRHWANHAAYARVYGVYHDPTVFTWALTRIRTILDILGSEDPYQLAYEGADVEAVVQQIDDPDALEVRAARDYRDLGDVTESCVVAPDVRQAWLRRGAVVERSGGTWLVPRWIEDVWQRFEAALHGGHGRGDFRWCDRFACPFIGGRTFRTTDDAPSPDVVVYGASGLSMSRFVEIAEWWAKQDAPGTLVWAGDARHLGTRLVRIWPTIQGFDRWEGLEGPTMSGSRPKSKSKSLMSIPGVHPMTGACDEATIHRVYDRFASRGKKHRSDLVWVAFDTETLARLRLALRALGHLGKFQVHDRVCVGEHHFVIAAIQDRPRTRKRPRKCTTTGDDWRRGHERYVVADDGAEYALSSLRDDRRLRHAIVFDPYELQRVRARIVVGVNPPASLVYRASVEASAEKHLVWLDDGGTRKETTYRLPAWNRMRSDHLSISEPNGGED